MSVDVSIDVGRRLGSPRLTQEGRDQITERLTDIAAELREFLIESWPVDTAFSLQAWEIRAAGLWLYVRNPIDYAEYVHRSGETTEVWREVQAVAEELVESALPDLRAIAEASRPAPSLAPDQTGVGPSRALRDALRATALFSARQRAFQRVGGRTRNALRARNRALLDNPAAAARAGLARPPAQLGIGAGVAGSGPLDGGSGSIL